MSVLTDSPLSGANAAMSAALGDDRAAVGVAGQHDRSVLGVDDLLGGFDVALR